jgi:alkylhydroperoxidase family enzyme
LAAGLSDADPIRSRRGTGASRQNAAIAQFAKRVAETRAVLTDAVFDSLRSAGLDDGLMIEIVANTVHNILANHVNHIADTDIDFPKVDATLAEKAA